MVVDVEEEVISTSHPQCDEDAFQRVICDTTRSPCHAVVQCGSLLMRKIAGGTR